MLGAHLLPSHYAPSKCEPIFYNLEIVKENITYPYNPSVPVFDYSAMNIKKSESIIESAFNDGYHRFFYRKPLQHHLPISYHPCLSGKINHESPKPIDVLFVGSITERRKKALDDLFKRTPDSVVAFDVYGEKRDELYSQAKIILNMHAYDTKIFEIVRCSYLMANKMCIVSEVGDDEDIEAPYRDGIAFCEYDRLIDKCLELLERPDERERLAETGFEVFSKTSMIENLRKVL